jgi:prepilin-type N-terminal cleavage/methylation domain-containing protein
MKTIQKFIRKLKKLAENRKGFSLTELMVAVSITSLVASMSAGQMDAVIPLARDTQRKANIHQVQTALHFYFADHGHYPIAASGQPSENGWQIMKTALEGDNPLTSYMPEVPADPLNDDAHKFKYWSDGNKFKITFETEDLKDVSPAVAYGL